MFPFCFAKLTLMILVFDLGANDWAQKTLKDHAKDPRPYVYTREQLEKAQTHDKLWNAAQVSFTVLTAHRLSTCKPANSASLRTTRLVFIY